MRLISKFITSQPGKQTITIHILPNISRSKGNHVMKFGQAIEYYKRNTFLQKPCRNVAERLVPDIFFVFKEALDEVKASCLQVSFNIVW